MVTLDEFKKMDLRIADVIESRPHPQADRLVVLKIKIGEEEKQLVAGIKAFYSPEVLPGKQIVIINNLEPATIRGIESQGMLLAVKDDEGIALLSPDRKVSSGSQVK